MTYPTPIHFIIVFILFGGIYYALITVVARQFNWQSTWFYLVAFFGLYPYFSGIAKVFSSGSGIMATLGNATEGFANLFHYIIPIAIIPVAIYALVSLIRYFK